MTGTELALLGNVLLGYVLQWVRAPKRIPIWLSYAGLVVAGAAIYAWITPDIEKTWATNWRAAVAGLVSFLLASRGAASASADTKAAPKTDSL